MALRYEEGLWERLVWGLSMGNLWCAHVPAGPMEIWGWLGWLQSNPGRGELQEVTTPHQSAKLERGGRFLTSHLF